MNILIFDMDGVLLKPQGYHQALKETVRLAGISAGIGEVSLTDEQIAQFEALGISSEWHSSALCLAVITIQQQSDTAQTSQPDYLELGDLFEAIADQPMKDPALMRGVRAIERLAEAVRLPSSPAKEYVESSESIQRSATMNWFQEMILGSDLYASTYQKEAQLHTGSYLKLHDERIISSENAGKVLDWAAQDDYGAAIMTNRPSRGPRGMRSDPDADFGASLVGFETMPIIGYGEICWLGEYVQREANELSKPHWAHALAAILAASGWSLEESLIRVSEKLLNHGSDRLGHLKGSTITVFEDTPAGLVAVRETGALLNQAGLNVKIQQIGIAEDPIKKTSLAAQRAEVFPDINLALDSLYSKDLG